MPMLFGTIYRTCPYCCEKIADGEVYEVARVIGDSPINGMTVHATCARHRDFASECPSECRSQEEK